MVVQDSATLDPEERQEMDGKTNKNESIGDASSNSNYKQVNLVHEHPIFKKVEEGDIEQVSNYIEVNNSKLFGINSAHARPEFQFACLWVYQNICRSIFNSLLYL